MATIYNTIEKTAGVPRAGVSVNIQLTWDTDVSPVAFDEDQTMINGSYNVATNNDGMWEVAEIVENENITPAGSLYKVVEDYGSTSTTYYISIPVGASPSYWVGDLLASTPDWEG